MVLSVKLINCYIDFIILFNLEQSIILIVIYSITFKFLTMKNKTIMKTMSHLNIYILLISVYNGKTYSFTLFSLWYNFHISTSSHSRLRLVRGSTGGIVPIRVWMHLSSAGIRILHNYMNT